MASRLEETKREIDDNIERVRSLVGEGKSKEASSLVAATESLIGSLRSKKQQESKRAELEQAGTPPAAFQPEPLPEVNDYKLIEGVPQLVEQVGAAMAKGVGAQLEAQDFSESMAKHILDIRLSITNRAMVPDLKAHTQAARDAARDAYGIAGRIFMEEHPDYDQARVEDAVDDLMVSVHNQWAEVLVSFIDGLDDDPELAKKHFAVALEVHPDESPSRAVRQHYAALGKSYELPTMGRNTKRRLKRALARAEQEGDTEAIADLQRKLGMDVAPREIERDPQTTANTFMGHLRKDLAVADELVPLISQLPDEARKALRETAEDVITTAKQIVAETL